MTIRNIYLEAVNKEELVFKASLNSLNFDKREEKYALNIQL